MTGLLDLVGEVLWLGLLLALYPYVWAGSLVLAAGAGWWAGYRSGRCEGCECPCSVPLDDDLDDDATGVAEAVGVYHDPRAEQALDYPQLPDAVVYQLDAQLDRWRAER